MKDWQIDNLIYTLGLPIYSTGVIDIHLERSGYVAGCNSKNSGKFAGI